MIYGKLSNIKDYKGINENLDTAIDFLLTQNLSTLPPGITNIKGDDIYINVMEIETKDESQVEFEVHKNHFDVFIPIIGSEKVLIGDSDYNNPTEYNEESDIFFVKTNTVNTAIVTEGHFILCYTNEPHKPSLAVECSSKLKKAVVKILK